MCPQMCLWFVTPERQGIFSDDAQLQAASFLCSPDRVLSFCGEGMAASAKGLKEPDKFTAYNHLFSPRHLKNNH